MAGGGGNKKKFQHRNDPSGQEMQYCTDSSGTIVYFRALQGHSRRNLIDLSLQDNVLIPNNFFEYINHIGCAINLHSIINSGLIPGGQILSKRTTVFFTSVQKNHQDPMELDLTKPRLAQYKREWKVHQDTVYWVDMKLAQRKGLKFSQTRSNTVILYDTLPACYIPKAIVMRSQEIIYQKVYCVTSTTTDDFLQKRIELKPNTQLSSTGRPVTKKNEETLKRTKFDRDTLNQ